MAFSQWLVPYFVNVYYLSLVTAGILAAMFSLPAGVIRAAGGWMSDRLGARQVMYWVLGISAVLSLMLVVPKMDVYSPGEGVMAMRPGTVTEISGSVIVVDNQRYPLKESDEIQENLDDDLLIFPAKFTWQESVVEVGQKVQRRELLAKGVTRIHFQANVWIFAGFVILLGSTWGLVAPQFLSIYPPTFQMKLASLGAW